MLLFSDNDDQPYTPETEREKSYTNVWFFLCLLTAVLPPPLFAFNHTFLWFVLIHFHLPLGARCK